LSLNQSVKWMSDINISVFGGCHVAGYPYEVAQAFPSLLTAQLEGQVVERIANLQFVKLPKHLPLIETSRPSHVLLQLGNYEFCASAKSLLTQSYRSWGLKTAGKKRNKSTATAGATATSSPASVSGKLLTKEKLYVRVGTLGLLTSVLWLCSPQHRRAFRALNACVQQHPNTRFLFLSPLPHLDPAVDVLRRLGSWLLRRGLAPAANLYWVDSHELIQRDPALFYDLGHLNEEGHRSLAAKLAGILPAL
jgi:hypothetical protein